MTGEYISGKHWSRGELIEHLYGVRAPDAHLSGCHACRERLEDCRRARALVEQEWQASEEVSPALLAAQRRRLYQTIDRPQHWWSLGTRPQWASAALAIALLAGGATVVNQKFGSGAQPTVPVVKNTLSDSELADEVSSFADAAEPSPAAPLQGLFQD